MIRIWLLAFATMLVALSAGADEKTRASLRPYEAPLYGVAPALPPLPPEYLQHDADGIRFAYHPSARERVRVLIEEAAGIRDELARDLGADVLRSVDVRVAVEGADLARVVPAYAPQGSGVIAFTELSLIALSLSTGSSSGSQQALASFRRGLAFLALDEATGAQGLPRWFRIGYALNFAGQASLGRARSLWWASMQDQLIPLVDLDWYLSDRAAYSSVAAAQAADFARFLLEGERAEAFPALVGELREGKSFDDALRVSHQVDLHLLELAWREDVARHRAFLPVLLGSTALWLLIVAGVALRRRWPRRRGRHERTLKTPQVRIVKIARKQVDPTPVGVSGAEAEGPDVPKVSHNGRWHTLH